MPTLSNSVNCRYGMSRALSDEDASKEMKKMVTFIMQEATEKVKEIRIKADEEFNIEKAKLVRQETVSIETNFIKRLSQAEVKRKMYHNFIFFNNLLFYSAQSNQINKTRLKILQYRDERLTEIIEEARNALDSLKKDPISYSNLLFDLSLDVFYRLMEGEVLLECVSGDLELVRDASVKAAELFKNSTGINIRVSVVANLSEN